MLSKFSFGHNVFRSLLLHIRQNASIGGKGLINNVYIIHVVSHI